MVNRTYKELSASEDPIISGSICGYYFLGIKFATNCELRVDR